MPHSFLEILSYHIIFESVTTFRMPQWGSGKDRKDFSAKSFLLCSAFHNLLTITDLFSLLCSFYVFLTVFKLKFFKQDIH